MLKAAGLSGIRFHDLRYTFATEALEHGMDVKTLSAVISYVSAATTLDIYTHVTDQSRIRAAEKIDRGMGGKPAARSRKKHSRNIYAHSLAECEEKLAAMIK